jgi:hypothetical protein
VKPEDINHMRPDDRFHIHGFRIVVDRQEWPRGLGWLQRLVERYWPPIPRGSVFTMKVNGNTVLQVPLGEWPIAPGPSATASFARHVLVLSPTDQFECGVQFPKAMPLRGAVPVRVMVDGYLVRGRDRIRDVIVADTSPEGP